MKTLEELKNTANLLIKKTGLDGGMGEIHYGKLTASVIWSFGGGWEHVSVSPFKRSYTPSWDEMCRLKEMFFYDDEAVVQYHPAKSEYVNNLTNCLHLWRPINEKLPTPPSIMVGIKDGQSLSDIEKEIKALEEKETINNIITSNFSEEMREFLLLVREHPELPVVPMVKTERIGLEEFEYLVANISRSEIGEFATKADGEIVWRDDPDAEGTLVEEIVETKYDGTEADYEQAKEEAAGLWTKAIIVYIVP